MLSTLFKNKVLFYDEENFSSFVHNNLNINSHSTNLSANDDDSFSKESFFINNVGDVLNNVDNWRLYLPSVGMYYTVRANPDPVLLGILNCYNVKFSCTTGPEIQFLLNCGISSSSIVYGGLCKMSSHIRTAVINKVNTICFGTFAELKRIVDIHSGAKLILRFNLDKIDDCCSTESPLNLAVNGIEGIREMLPKVLGLNTTIYGLHFEITNPNNCSKSAYESVFKQLTDIINMAKNEFGITIKCINIGSGVPSFSTDCDSVFQTFVQLINTFVGNYPNIEIIAEPGEFIVENAVQLCCNVIGTRDVCDIKSGKSSMFYYLNDGLYGSLSKVLYREYCPEPVVMKKNCISIENQSSNISNMTRATLWGPTCDSMDKICTVDTFPILDVGDLVIFKDFGLYTRCCASNFNGFSISNNRHIISYQRLESLGIDRLTADLSREDFVEGVTA